MLQQMFKRQLTLISIHGRGICVGRMSDVVESGAGRERAGVALGRLGLIPGRGRIEAGRGRLLVPVVLEVVARRDRARGVPGRAVAVAGAGRGAAAVVARRGAAVVGRAGAVVHGRLRAVHGCAGAGGGRAVQRRVAAVGGVERGGEGAAGRAAERLGAVDDGEADEVDADGLALGVQLHARCGVRGVLAIQI